MQGIDVYRVLKSIGAQHLHHANSVTTSTTFLQQGGLASRGFVEDHNLTQTPQSSDAADKKFGIWHRVFVDHVDIHDRAGRIKGPNQYGPVLFQTDLDVLLTLPPGSEVLVTKRNPIYWSDNERDAERYFLTPQELAENINFGDFAKMLVIRTPSGKLDFPDQRARIILDDPQRYLSSGRDAYTYAVDKLSRVAKAGRIDVLIERRECRPGCACLAKYRTMTTNVFDSWFA